MPIPKHTFGEGVVVNGEEFFFNPSDIYYVPTWVDEFFLPFRHSCGSTFVACGLLPYTLGKARKAVIAQIKHLESIGTKWDRRKHD